MEKAALLAKVKNACQQYPEIHTVLVFGSQANNTALSASDVDIAVAANKPLSADERLTIYLDLEAALQHSVDLKDLSMLSGLILAEILQNGILVYCQNEQFLEKKLWEMRDYCQDIQVIQDEASQQKLQEYVNGQ